MGQLTEQWNAGSAVPAAPAGKLFRFQGCGTATAAAVQTRSGPTCRIAALVARLAADQNVDEAVGGPTRPHPCRGARIVGRLHAILDRLKRLPQPTIAAIDGAAVGWGTELALACTFRVAGEAAKLGLPEVGLGVIPGGGGTQRLPGVIGRARALDLVLNTRILTAQQAHSIGLVHQLVPKGEDRAAAVAWAAEIATRPRVALQAAKRALLAAGRSDGYETERKAFAETAASEDMNEGVTAFLEKRPAVFKHH